MISFFIITDVKKKPIEDKPEGSGNIVKDHSGSGLGDYVWADSMSGSGEGAWDSSASGKSLIKCN